MLEVQMLHRVTRTEDDRLGPYGFQSVTTDELRRWLDGRRRWASVADAKSAETASQSGQAFWLTFDDGYRNNLTEALPVLEEFEAAATIFVTTGFISRERYPVELELAHVWITRDSVDLPPGWGTRTSSSRETGEAYNAVRVRMKALSPEQRERTLDELAATNGYDRAAHRTERFLDWDDLRRLDRHPLITIGAHTQAHPLLVRLDPLAAWREIAGSKGRLEAELGHEVDQFAYPYGAHNLLVRGLVRLAGFDLAFDTEAATLERLSSASQYAVPRLDLAAAIVHGRSK